MTADGDFRRWRLPAAALVSLHVLLLAWLAAVASTSSKAEAVTTPCRFRR